MNEIKPSPDDITKYLDVVFGYLDGYIPFRSFSEKGADNERAPHNIWVDTSGNITEIANNFANWADKEKVAFYVIPGTTENPNEASSEHIKQIGTVLVDLDTGNTEEKLETLAKCLFEPTLIVESGGVTEDGHKKLHAYWKLSEAAEGEELKKVLKLRHHIALSIGGDSHFKSAHQPIRVAGSTYHKGGNHKLVTIRSCKEKLEYDLGDLIELSEDLPKPENLPAYSKGGDFLDFNNVAPTIDEILTTTIHEGGEGEHTRFNYIQKVAGHWLSCYYDDLVSDKEAWEKIENYNKACVVPSFEDKKLKDIVNGLWDVHVSKRGLPPHLLEPQKNESSCASFSLGVLLNDHTPLPDDIIAPRILTPGDLMVFGGAPKVGKSDFLLSMFTHLAAGHEFLGFKPSKPLRIFYFQAEIGYHYLRERLQTMQLPPDLVALAQNNLFITPNTKLQLNEEGVNSIVAHIKGSLQEMPDIIAVDPIRNVFDGGTPDATENSNKEMLFFLQNRVEPLRDKINPKAGIVLVHHTKKIEHKKFIEDPFQAFSGASSLRGYYSTGIILHKPNPKSIDCELVFELRNGASIPDKIVHKSKNSWIEINPLNKRITNQKYGEKLDAERVRRIRVIVRTLETEAKKGKFYLMKQFSEKFHNKLGGQRQIYDDCSTAATQGLVQFFNNPKEYDLSIISKGYGFMCTQNMKMVTNKTKDPNTDEIFKEYAHIVPVTHYKRDGDGKRMDIIDAPMWTSFDDLKEVKNAS